MSTTVTGLYPKMLGRMVGALSVASATESDGVFTISSTVVGDLHVNQNLLDFQYKMSYEKENQAATDVFIEDNVATAAMIEVTITEQRLAGGLSGSPLPILEQIFNAGTHIRVQRNYVIPGSSVNHIFLALLFIDDFDGGSIERGVNKCTLTASAAGINYFTAAGTSVTLPF